MLENLVDDDREEVANIMTNILPVLNASEPREAEGNINGLDSTADEVEEDATKNNRPNGRRPKATTSKKGRFLNLATTVFINEVDVKFSEEKKNCEKSEKRKI